MDEIWKNINEFDDKYLISNLGRVKSLERLRIRNKMGVVKVQEKILNPHIDKVGYPRVTLYNDTFKKRFCVHKLVAMCFIDNPNNYSIINHIDGIKTNNIFSNLEWCTQKHNIIHSFENKLNVASRGEEKGNAKLKEKDVLEIRILLNDNKYTQKQIGEKYGVTRGAIKGIKFNKNWKHI